MEMIQRHTALVIGIVLCGLLGALAAHWMVLPTGGASPGALSSESPVIALGFVFVCLAIAAIIAALVGKFSNAAVGLFVLGCGVFVLSRRSGTVVDLALAGGGPWIIALETLLWAGLILLATMAMFAIAGPLRDIEPDEHGRVPSPYVSSEALTSAAMGAVVLIGVWVIAQSFDKGQAVAAVFLGCVAAGMAGRLFSPHVQPILLFAAPCVFGALGHVIGAMMTGVAFDDGVVMRTLSSMNVPMPIDYAAGSLTGVAIGLGWARSMLHHEDVPHKVP